MSLAVATSQYERDETDRDRLETGVVKFYNHDKRFGFISRTDTTKAAVVLAGTAARSAGLNGVYTGQKL